MYFVYVRTPPLQCYQSQSVFSVTEQLRVSKQNANSQEVRSMENMRNVCVCVCVCMCVCAHMHMSVLCTDRLSYILVYRSRLFYTRF